MRRMCRCELAVTGFSTSSAQMPAAAEVHHKAAASINWQEWQQRGGNACSSGGISVALQPCQVHSNPAHRWPGRAAARRRSSSPGPTGAGGPRFRGPPRRSRRWRPASCLLGRLEGKGRTEGDWAKLPTGAMQCSRNRQSMKPQASVSCQAWLCVNRAKGP